jgi:hypothetical protein
MQRVDSSLDVPSHFTEMGVNRSAKENMKEYMNNFGIEFLIPALFVQDAIIYPVNPIYSI